MKILILEDHSIICHVIEKIIIDINPSIDIIYFDSWEHALKDIETNKPDFVITDIQIRSYKQTEILTACSNLKIPCMVYSSNINYTVMQYCHQLKISVIVSKLSSINNLRNGIIQLLQGNSYRCEISQETDDNHEKHQREIPKIIFSAAEENVIIAQMEGKSTIELSKESKKSKYTIRNQPMSLMLKNDCSMEEIIRRYIYWHRSE